MHTILDEILSNKSKCGSRHGNRCGCQKCSSGKAQESETRAYHPQLGQGEPVTREIHEHEISSPSPVFFAQTGDNSLDSEYELIGNDDRKKINSLKVPMRWICSLQLYFPDPDSPGNHIRFRGSGVLVADAHVLTAGHCLFARYKGSSGTWTIRQVSKVYCYPGRSNKWFPFGKSQSRNVIVHPNWQASRNARYDLGMIKLKTALGKITTKSTGGTPLGHWGSTSNGSGTRIVHLADNIILNKKANLSGYPADKSNTQWWDADKVVNVTPKYGSELIYYTIDTCAGQSGSPVWLTNTSQGSRYMIAIHTGPCIPASGSNDCTPINSTTCMPGRQSYSSNRGVRLTKGVILLIKSWIRKM